PEKEQGKEYLWEEVANATLASLTRKLFPVISVQSGLSIDSLEGAYNTRLMKWSENGAFERSQKLGQDVAQAIFDFSKTDLFNLANAAYVPPVFPGAWEPSPPAFAAAAVPYLGNVRPFLENHSTGLAPTPPFPYSTVPTSDYYKMIKDVYDVSFTRTTDQTNIALFWNDIGAGKGYTPSGHAINILSHIIQNENIKLGTAVLCYAKAGMGMWDATIMTWRSKFTYNQIRPVTFIRNNIDATWLPLIPTPPHPEYPAAHAYITTATMESIASVIGDNHYIDDHTYDFLGFPNRHYTSLFSIGVESGMSRRFGGIHYMPSITVGINLGKKVGDDVGNVDLGKGEKEEN
ncbi:MAG: vanadium-dependent haloperoxidase, partial [Flavisolibacter sp.]